MKLYSETHYDPDDYEAIANQIIPTLLPGVNVPLRQVADLSPDWHPAQIVRHNNKNNSKVIKHIRRLISIALWFLLGGLLSLIGSALGAIGSAIGTFLGNLIAGIFSGGEILVIPSAE